MLLRQPRWLHNRLCTPQPNDAVIKHAHNTTLNVAQSMTTRMVSKRRTQEEISGSSRDGACAQADESASPPEAAAQTCQRARGTAARVNNEKRTPHDARQRRVGTALWTTLTEGVCPATCSDSELDFKLPTKRHPHSTKLLAAGCTPNE